LTVWVGTFVTSGSQNGDGMALPSEDLRPYYALQERGSLTTPPWQTREHPMNMSIKPRYLIVAAVAAGGLYALGASVGTILFVLALAYMASMHLGHGGGHGGCGGHSDSKSTSDTAQAPSGQQPPAGKGHLGQH
jgi:hypothetical protein